jgi:hypothetical protein
MQASLSPFVIPVLLARRYGNILRIYSFTCFGHPQIHVPLSLSFCYVCLQKKTAIFEQKQICDGIIVAYVNFNSRFLLLENASREFDVSKFTPVHITCSVI